jgi:hypothetical protein
MKKGLHGEKRWRVVALFWSSLVSFVHRFLLVKRQTSFCDTVALNTSVL